MINEYLVNKEDLTTVANAIREKTGSSGDLSFPDGFVSAVNSISTGAELQFSIVGGSNYPTNPTNNTIWINTTTSIPNWQISSFQPTTPNYGMVWINTALHTDTLINAIPNNAIILQPTKAYQYLWSWVAVDMEIYQNGSWNTVDADVILYDYGAEATAITGGLYPSSATEYAVRDSYIEFYNGFYSTSHKINLTDYSLLKVTIRCDSGNPSSIGVSTGTTFFTAQVQTTAEDQIQVLSLPLDSFNGEYYIVAQSCSSSSGTLIYKIELIA